MRKITLLILTSLLCSLGFAQSFPGYNSGNYIGVNGVFFNPANIADSRYRWDVNLFGMNAYVGNSNAQLSLNSLSNGLKVTNVDSFLFGKSLNTLTALANVDILGPSVMFNVSKKTSFAITTRIRMMANFDNIDGQMIQSLKNNLDSASYPINISSPNTQQIHANAWADIGVSMGQVLMDKGKNFLKAGITLKYEAGVANTFVNISNFNGTANNDGQTYFTNSRGAVALGITGVSLDSSFKASDLLKYKGTGFGADLGLVYEYRPNENSHRYKFKAGLSLLDIGAISYTPDSSQTASYNALIPANAKWYPNFQGSSLSQIKSILDTTSYFTNTHVAASRYSVPLPAHILANVDYNIHRGFYVDLMAELNLVSKSNLYATHYNNSVTLTPRYEGKSFGFYLPVSYNSLTNFNAGVSLRLGPIFIGSGSIITALSNTKQMDFHIGLMHIGVLKKHKKAKTVKPVEQLVVVQPVKALDSDSDGVVDSLDKCPTVPGLARYHGCPIPDTDGDGINDEEDSCPTVKGVAKYHGCPIPDTDGDGINDEEDSCPTVKGVAKYHGCPIPDTDGDGINDEEDSCPTVKGVARYHGCPIPDTDGDGVNDEEDWCPTVPGPASNHGCPIIKKEIIQKVNIAAKNLLFVTGKSVILKKSYLQLNNVVKILKSDSTLKMEINGYTDNVGDSLKNLKLSQARADAAKKYFVIKGIDPARIAALGHGINNPIATNKTLVGRAKNRRVEFVLKNY